MKTTSDIILLPSECPKFKSRPCPHQTNYLSRIMFLPAADSEWGSCLASWQVQHGQALGLNSRLCRPSSAGDTESWVSVRGYGDNADAGVTAVLICLPAWRARPVRTQILSLMQALFSGIEQRLQKDCSVLLVVLVEMAV